MGGEDGKTKCLKVNVYFFILVSDGRRSKTPKGEFKLHERDFMLSLRKKSQSTFLCAFDSLSGLADIQPYIL